MGLQDNHLSCQTITGKMVQIGLKFFGMVTTTQYSRSQITFDFEHLKHLQKKHLKMLSQCLNRLLHIFVNIII